MTVCPGYTGCRSPAPRRRRGQRGFVGRDHRQVAGVDLQYRQIGQAVGADQQRFVAAAVLQHHGDLLGVFDHVAVGDDIAAFVHDHAGAERQHVGGAVQVAVVDVDHGGRGAAHRLVVAHRCFVAGILGFSANRPLEERSMGRAANSRPATMRPITTERKSLANMEFSWCGERCSEDSMS